MLSLTARRHNDSRGRTITPPQRVRINLDLPHTLMNAENLHEMDLTRETVKFVALAENGEEFAAVAALFYETTANLRVFLIERVRNPFLLCAYELTRQRRRKRHGYIFEQQLFHATRPENVLSICENNFNWRCHGRTKGHRYGRGISFTPRAGYADMFADKSNHERVMFLADVLMGNACDGHEEMSLPPPGYDCSQKPNGDVIVKYEDNEFYPRYVISYTDEGGERLLHSCPVPVK